MLDEIPLSISISPEAIHRKSKPCKGKPRANQVWWNEHPFRFLIWKWCVAHRSTGYVAKYSNYVYTLLRFNSLGCDRMRSDALRCGVKWSGEEWRGVELEWWLFGSMMPSTNLIYAMFSDAVIKLKRWHVFYLIFVFCYIWMSINMRMVILLGIIIWRSYANFVRTKQA